MYEYAPVMGCIRVFLLVFLLAFLLINTSVAATVFSGCNFMMINLLFSTLLYVYNFSQFFLPLFGGGGIFHHLSHSRRRY